MCPHKEVTHGKPHLRNLESWGLHKAGTGHKHSGRTISNAISIELSFVLHQCGLMLPFSLFCFQQLLPFLKVKFFSAIITKTP